MGDYGMRMQQAVRAQIRAELGARGLRQADIARETGLGTGTLSRYLSDDRDRDIPLPVVADIAQALELGLPALLERSSRRLTGDGPY